MLTDVSNVGNMRHMTNYLSVKQVASLLGVSVATVRRMVKRGDLPHLRVGKLIRIPADAIPHD